MMTLLVILGLAGMIFLYLVASYNSFIKLKNLVKEAWSGIDVQLKRRFDLIPNLIETVKGYATHEKGTFEEVARLRNLAGGATTVADRSAAESALSQGLGRLIAIAENYPQLKADANFQSLQSTLGTLEDEIQMARRYYNGVVRDYNTGVQSFPGNIIAGMFHFSPEQFFELDNPAERQTPQVKF